MTPQSNEFSQESTSTSTRTECNTPHLSSMFSGMSTTSNDVNKVAASPTDQDDLEQPQSVFENLKMVVGLPRTERYLTRQRVNFKLVDNPGNFYDSSISTPSDHSSFWEKYVRNSQQNLLPDPLFLLPVPQNDPLTDEDLLRMKGPSRLIGFLIHIAMKAEARKALKWTGNGLEFVLVNKELVAQMWGQRKNNTKVMDYYKLSRAIREKYEKNGKPGKLKKGTRTYSYVFTEHSYQDILNQTKEKSIDYIFEFASDVGKKYQDNNETAQPNSPRHDSD